MAGLAPEVQEQEVRPKEHVSATVIIDIDIGKENWPACWPMMHSDIANDIPVHLRGLQYIAFTSFLGLVFALTWNMVAAQTYFYKKQGATPKEVNLGDMLTLFGTICWIPFFVVWAYALWYRPLYRACMGWVDSKQRFEWFYLWHVVHIIVCVYAAIAPPLLTGKAVAGFWTALDFIRNKHFLLGKLYFIGFGIFTLEALLSIYVLQQVYMYFRGGGKEAHEAARVAHSAEV